MSGTLGTRTRRNWPHAVEGRSHIVQGRAIEGRNRIMMGRVVVEYPRTQLSHVKQCVPRDNFQRLKHPSRRMRPSGRERREETPHTMDMCTVRARRWLLKRAHNPSRALEHCWGNPCWRDDICSHRFVACSASAQSRGRYIGPRSISSSSATSRRTTMGAPCHRSSQEASRDK